MRRSSLGLLMPAILMIAPMAACGAKAQGQSTSAKPVAAPSVSWARFTDPAEGAFSIDVPTGWRVLGGTVRKSPIEIPMGVQATSPDGAITIFYGDPNIPIYSVPSGMTAMARLGPGAVYNMGNGVSTVIMPYMDGRTFAAQWGAVRVAAACGSPKLMGSRARPDSSQGLDTAYAQGGVRTSVNAGEASFACNLGGQEGGGYVFAATELVQTPSSQIWDVKYVVGAIAPAGRAAEAYAILAHMAQSFTINRAWMGQQQNIGAQFDQMVARTNAVVSQRIIDDGKAAAAASERMFKAGQQNAQTVYNANENFDAFAIRGTSDFRDPNTGQVYTGVDNSHDHVYVSNDSNHTIVPIDGPPPPGGNWTELQIVGPGH